MVAEQLRAGRSLVVDANFDPAFAEPEFRRLPPFRALQVYCTAEPEVVRQRFAARAHDGSRHPGHVDETASAEIAAALDAGHWRPLDLEGERIDIDTSDSAPVQVGPLVARARRLAE